MNSYERGVHYDTAETRREIIGLTGIRCQACKHDRDVNAHVEEDPCYCGCRTDTYILEAVHKVTKDPWWRTQMPANCGCDCHSIPGVKHVAACCSAPPVDF
jgi:hypothetical protein